MLPENDFKAQKFYHHDDSRYSHPHDHLETSNSEIATQKSCNGDSIDVIRNPLPIWHLTPFSENVLFFGWVFAF